MRVEARYVKRKNLIPYLTPELAKSIKIGKSKAEKEAIKKSVSFFLFLKIFLNLFFIFRKQIQIKTEMKLKLKKKNRKLKKNKFKKRMKMRPRLLWVFPLLGHPCTRIIFNSKLCRKCKIVSVKKTINFATWWRHFSGPKVVGNVIFILWPLKWCHQVAKFILFLQKQA